MYNLFIIQFKKYYKNKIMGNCGNKIKQTCAGTQNTALCTKYEGTLSIYSDLVEGECLDTQEVIEDLYGLHDKIKEDINITGISNDCIIFTEPKTIASVVEQMYLKICQMEDIIQTQTSEILIMQQEINDLQENNCP